jgi:DNA repair exonuclease SbcCD nuclease subunit
MVGHFHGKSQGTHHAYPGSPEPLNFTQDGEHTASMVTVDGGRVTVEFERLNQTLYVDAELDVAGYEDSAALVQAIRSKAASVVSIPGSTFCRFRLLGAAPASLDPDLHALRDELTERFPGFELIEDYEAFDLDAIAHEGNTVRAAFVAAMRKRIARAVDGELATEQAALRYGLLAFAKKKLRA